MMPDLIAPTILGQHGPVEPAICRVSPDWTLLAFWVPQANPPGLFVGEIAHGDLIGLFAKRVFSPPDGHVAELSWSRDGQWLGFTLTAGPPPGFVRIAAIRLSDNSLTELPGMGFSWAGSSATLLIADPASLRLYLKDLELGVEHRLCEIADDGDPHFPPVISVSPDQRRFALITRRVREEATYVHLAHHDGRQWETRPLTQVPGVSLRIFPFWSFDSAALALYIIDLETNRSAMIALPQREGPGDILYTSESIDGFVTPAPHPDGRLIAFIRSHAGEPGGNHAENRLVLLDPVDRSVASITADPQIIGHLRWLDPQILLVEGDAAVWTVRLRATLESQSPAPEDSPPSTAPVESPAESTAAHDPFTRTVVRDIEPRFTFVCEIPGDWKRTALPAQVVDFADPRVMRPLCVFSPGDAALIFTVATRPLIPGLTPSAALSFLSHIQGFAIGEVRDISLPCGHAVETLATQTVGADTMTWRLIMIEDGGHLFSIAVMAPAPLWDAVKPIFDHIVDSFVLLDPLGPTPPTSG